MLMRALFEAQSLRIVSANVFIEPQKELAICRILGSSFSGQALSRAGSAMVILST